MAEIGTFEVKVSTEALVRQAEEVVVTGKKAIKSLTLDKDVVDPDDVEMLQDLITAAVNEAMRQMDELAESEMNKITGGFGGMGIPGL